MAPWTLCVAVATLAAVRLSCAATEAQVWTGVPAATDCGQHQCHQRHTFLLQSSKKVSVGSLDALRHEDLDAGSVLYVVKTYSGFYESKLRVLMQTWGSTLRRSSLLLVGDKPSTDLPVTPVPSCESDATQGLACRVAQAMVLAAKHPGNWSWVFVVDDDHYVRPPRVEAVLAKFDASKPIGAGCYGCGRPQYCEGFGGFCGGCGYAFSRPAVMAMVGSSETEFRELHNKIAHSPLSEGREDMAISCAMHRRVPELQVELLGTVNGDQPSAAELAALHTLQEQEGAMSWHHVAPSMMLEMHKALFGK